MSSASNNMDKKLLLIQHLYGEREDAEELKELLKDPACRAEYEVLRAVKRKLENRALRRPVSAPEDAIDKIIASTRPKLTPIWKLPARRSKRFAVLGGAAAVAACLLVVFLLPGRQTQEPAVISDEVPNPVELVNWDDTQKRIEMQQTLNVVRQRTRPDLWDESAVMRLDSIAGNLNSSPSGVESASTLPQ